MSTPSAPGSRRWRLIVDDAAPGPRNMATDEALLWSAVRQGRATLRLYAWKGPWLSHGYAQRLSPARRVACAAAGVGVVARITGGRAVLHGADFTYALAAPASWLPAGLRGSYGLVADALVAALRTLGVEAERVAGTGPLPGEAFDCFAEPAADEISVAGRKLVGSAQRRVRGGVLQHGSLRLAPDPPAAAAAAKIPGGSSTSLAELGCSAQGPALRQAMVTALGSALGARFFTAPLTADEEAAVEARAGQLRRAPGEPGKAPAGPQGQTGRIR